MPWVSLTRGPTPVEPLERLGEALGGVAIHVKRDDVGGQWYGGNKPRKLEFLLADALQKGARSVITLGALGSHHTLATAVYCHQLGLRPVLGFANRPLGEREKPNLEASFRLGADMFFLPRDIYLLGKLPYHWLNRYIRDRKAPYFISPGGSSALGCMGYVSAALELVEQINRGDAVTPDEIWLPAGSLGTIAGLVLGLRLAGLHCRVVGVKIYPAGRISVAGINKLVGRAERYLRHFLPDLPPAGSGDSSVEVIEEFLGDGYGITTPAAEAAIRLARESEQIALEHVYTAKCMAALIDAARGGRFSNKKVLFWNTYNSLRYQDRLPADVAGPVPDFVTRVLEG